MSECPLLTYMHEVEAWCYNSIGLYALTIDFLETRRHIGSQWVVHFRQVRFRCWEIELIPLDESGCGDRSQKSTLYTSIFVVVFHINLESYGSIINLMKYC